MAPSHPLLPSSPTPGLPDALEEGILELKRERNAVLLAHYYQHDEVQDLADFVGDSLELARAAQKVDRDVIVFCGVHFMAETAKILNPGRTVVVPDLEAGCSLADGCPTDEFRAFIDRHPGAGVLSYINTTAAVKAMSDLICTSSNAAKMAQWFEGRPLIFAPDRHLARWVAKQANRPDMIVWPGTCVVHEQFSAKRLVQLKVRHPDAEVLAHPECDDAVLAQADFVASTTGIIRRAVEWCLSPDPSARSGQAADPGPRDRRELLLQPMPVHAAQHVGQALPLPPRPQAGGDGSGRHPRQGAPAHRAHALALVKRAGTLVNVHPRPEPRNLGVNGLPDDLR
jgi:quinolinate synthase